MPGLHIRDETVNDLAIAVMKATNAPNKTEAVRRALQNELARLRKEVPLKERIKEIQDRIESRIGPNPKSEPFDMKAFMDEQWER
ncbi:type II toxin-antitoxin system VapB family antitoxin [Rhizobium sp. CG4]|uniref:type II toxin-antitoxin system VapB family antitoxin n=1 Tax=Rhizobium sp. CG4 TaxID=2726075 RepID=UPI0020334136|nr:type II toxin-antitoxin system VapB family antitoxin [Rhizobium sp. CG4]MCM2458849.1 type II toxin-antitoxin system VapB family antitoxin [Rhizobium sp. CG4]